MTSTKRISKALGIVVLTVFVLAVLGGYALFALSMCSHYKDSHPSRSEYVGVWACYKTKANETEIYAKNLDEVNSFLVLGQDGNAETVICIISKNDPFITESKWITTSEDRRAGTDEGIELIGDNYSNRYSFFYYPDRTELIDESLINGGLTIDYGYREEYYEKISNDPDYRPWNATDNASETPQDDAKFADSDSDGALPADAISWDKASSHVGETVTLYGPVVGAEYASTSNGQPTFLDIGVDYPDKKRLSITIWGKNRGTFSPSPEELYDGKTICVTGKVYIYDGVCNVEATSPEQIKVIG